MINRHATTGPVVFVKVTKRTLPTVLPRSRERGLDLEIVDLIKPAVFWNELDEIQATYASALADYQGALSLHAPFIDLYLHSLDPRVAALARSALEKTLSVSDALGIRYTILHGNLNPLIDDDTYRAHWVKTHVDFLSEVAVCFQTVPLLENLWDRTPELFRQVFDQLAPSSAQMCLDIGHCIVHSHLDIEEWLSVLGEHIKLLHLNDNDGKHDLELPPGRGIIDWRRLTQLINRYTARPHVSLELSSLEQVDEACEYMRTHGIYPFD